MTRVVFQVRCSEAQLGEWRRAAGGRALSVWLRQAADQKAQLDAALARQEGAGRGALAEADGDDPSAVASVSLKSPAVAAAQGQPAGGGKERQRHGLPPANAPGGVHEGMPLHAIPGVTVASRLPANFCRRTCLERAACLCPDCKGA